MAKVPKNNTASGSKRLSKPALTPEAQENELIYLANKCAKEQLLAGTASSQVITHFLKMGSSKNELELEKLKRENELLKAKTESLESAKRIEELYVAAIAQMKVYSGQGSSQEEESDEDIF